MSARDVIAVKLPTALKSEWADEILAALTAAGYRILAPGALDGPTIEACAKWHEDAAATLDSDAALAAKAGSYCFDSGGDLHHYADLHRGHSSALRALGGDDGR
jgi:putative hemolysin